MEYKEYPDKYITGEWKCQLLIVDQCIRRIWIYNMRSFKAKAILDKVMDWTSEYGQITELYFDAGSNFCSRLFTIPLEGLGVNWKNAPKGSHENVEIVERQVQEINRYHRKHIGALKE